MALYREMTASRVGGVKGFNATTETRIIRVIAEEADWQTVRVPEGRRRELPDPRDLVENNYIRLGAQHPWDETARAGSYGIIEHRGTGNWLVGVTYYRNNITIGVPPIDRWEVTWRGATVTRQIYTEPPPDTVSNIDPTWTRPSVEIGMPGYKKLDSDTGATHFANAFDGDGVATTLWLKEKSEATDQRGTLWEEPAMLVTFTRLIPNLYFTLATRIAPFMKGINRTLFRSARPLHVKCVDISLDPMAAEHPATRGDSLPYRASVSFLWSGTPWGPLELVSTVNDDEGHWATVHERGTGIVPKKQFRNANLVNFNDMLHLLERGW